MHQCLKVEDKGMKGGGGAKIITVMLTIRLSFSVGALRQKSSDNFVEFNLYELSNTLYLRDYDAFNSDSAKAQEFSLHFSKFRW